MRRLEYGVEHGAVGHAFIGIEKSGRTIAVIVEDVQYLDQVAKEVASLIRSGYRVERVTVEEARNRLKANQPGGAA